MNPRRLIVKCGGSAGIDCDAVCADVAELREEGTEVVLVHGGAADIEELGAALGIAQTIDTSPSGIASRRTNDATLDVLLLALAGRTGPRWVLALRRAGISAIGLSGIDGGVLVAQRKEVTKARVDGRVILVRGTHTGRITHVNRALLELVLASGVLPIVSPPALGEDGTVLNVDADRAAAAVAAALDAETLVLLTSGPVVADTREGATALSTYDLPRSGPLAGPAVGRMRMKLVAAREALAAGVGRVVVGDGRGAHPVRRALDGGGTELRLAAAEAWA